MKSEILFNTVELCEPALGEAPEILNAIDVNASAFRELIRSMIDPKMLIGTP